MAVPTWPLWVIFITGAQLTLENAANSSPPRKGEAIALDAAPFSCGEEGRRAPQGGQRSSIAPPTKAIGTGRFRIARDSTRLDFAPMKLVAAPPMGIAP
jgi:hypothetical protein